MKILAIDTAGRRCSVCVWEDGREVSFQEKESERDQARLLPQLVADVARQQKIDQLIVNIGPGSFTGIRVGIAFAKGLAMAWEIPVKGIDGFSATYLSLEDSQKDILIVLDARRTDLFCRRFREGVSQPPQILTREEIEKILAEPRPPAVTGNGTHPFLEGLTFKEASSHWQGAQKLAFAFFKAPHIVCEPAAFYMREADVTFSSKSLC